MPNVPKCWRQNFSSGEILEKIVLGCFSSAKDTFGLEESYKKEYEALPPDDDRPFEFRARPKSAPPGQDRGQYAFRFSFQY